MYATWRVPRTLRLSLSPTALVYRAQQVKGRLCLSVNSLAFKCCCVPSICKAINCNSRYWSTQVKPLEKLKFVNRPAAPHCLATDETMPPSILYNRCLLDTLSWQDIDDLILTRSKRWLLKGGCSIDDIEYRTRRDREAELVHRVSELGSNFSHT